MIIIIYNNTYKIVGSETRDGYMVSLGSGICASIWNYMTCVFQHIENDYIVRLTILNRQTTGKNGLL